MAKYWVISEVGWNYDDQYYYRGDNYGNNTYNAPTALYKRKVRAQQEVDGMNLEFFEDRFCKKDTWNCLQEYLGYDGVDGMPDPDKINELLVKHNMEHKYDSIFRVWDRDTSNIALGELFDKMTHEDKMAFIHATGVTMFEMHPVELED